MRRSTGSGGENTRPCMLMMPSLVAACVLTCRADSYLTRKTPPLAGAFLSQACRVFSFAGEKEAAAPGLRVAADATSSLPCLQLRDAHDRPGKPKGS